MMSRKHYVAIAAILAQLRRDDAEVERARRALGKEIAVYLKQDNPRFDRRRFLEAAQIQE